MFVTSRVQRREKRREINIEITGLSGPNAGRTREVPADVKPDELLRTFAEQDWNWRIQPEPDDSPETVFKWTRADMVARIIRALLHGRVVRFEGTEYRCERAAGGGGAGGGGGGGHP